MRTLKAEQAIAFEQIKVFIESENSMHLLTGAAGTGKTFTLKEIVEYVLMKKIRPVVTAPTNKAVKVLKKMVDLPVTFLTIHSALGMKEVINNDGSLSFKSDPKAGYPAEDYGLIIIDEASMLDDTIFEELVQLSYRGKKILFVGDPYQVPPINHIHARPFLKSIQAEYKIGISILNEIIRQAQNSPIISYATSIRSDIHKSVQIFKRQRLEEGFSSVFMVPKTDLTPFIEEVLPKFLSVEYKNDIDYVKILAWRNVVINKYNELIRTHIFGDNLPKIMTGDKLIADAPITENKKILISTNDEMEVISTTIESEVLSDLYTLKYYKARVKVFCNDIFNEYMIKIMHEDSDKDFEKILKMQRSLALSYSSGSYKAKSAWMDFYEFYNHWARVKYSYCVSVHKSQASTYQTAYILAWDIMLNPNILERNRVYYTAITRPSTNLYVEF